MQSRTHTCNELTSANIGESVVLVGFYENLRKVSKTLGFLILRDFYGTTQIVIETEDIMNQIASVNKESTLQIIGQVRERQSKNKNIATGDIEIIPTEVAVLGICEHNELPFEINRSTEADDNTRLKYRYLDLRNPAVKDKIALRSKVVSALRKKMESLDFLEITTPILTCSSPEGARDYLVPSRLHEGKFYALPQAPQQFKQILMASGFDRYFQIAPCFRDEDARADRAPGEFYQLDMEMAFANQEDVFAVIEEVLPEIFAKYGIYKTSSNPPFVRIPYLEALEKYGSDKPDLRNDLVVTDATALLQDCGFEPFANAVIKAIVVDKFDATRKVVDKICHDTEVIIENKAFWFRLGADGNFVGGISKFLADTKDAIIAQLALKPGDYVFLSAGTKLKAQKTAGVLRNVIGQHATSHVAENCYSFCWIVDFPMYELDDKTNKIEFCHNPFSMPQGGLEALNTQDPLSILAYQYDLVCNGVELSSGAVRNHDPSLMIKAFNVVGLGEADVKEKFPAMYNAFLYGAPPHAGIAPGVDRMIMLILGEDSIKEIIPFPMNKSAQDVMMNAPSFVSNEQLKDVHIAVTTNK
ncbi:aspartate--tRNA ligase [Candidatus Epulonipiscium viviparus]|uniref:aspartate--tRNA ligase n=1 Tax=Candidatus Epulonipiscium viviparus TaxID=420336 RepID=UPI0027380D94|nr:aspartate--tRNA ligase [Candidatus Epulopiscium viviparus]